ncbi:hypothetical protein [Kribbella sp. VKM Ac-2568]|uniref:hypothetical protein n=1 Tax=Kribbella sp. VKM Ac-2568 TaxID=2512219 RepID=UPI001049A356|nr:hypothetical protein [Kribbella sp. VKM Ac-2568]TCM45183.1 hypothetical protein EV648_107336 [Kribbella sp. VKM Ac-2568]
MSYDLVVWVGKRPKDAAEADERYEEVMDLLEANADNTPPNPRLVAYGAALVRRWPELDDAFDSPWVVSPLIADAVGDVFPFSIDSSRADEVAPYAARLAAEQGLTCYDPQEGALRP